MELEAVEYSSQSLLRFAPLAAEEGAMLLDSGGWGGEQGRFDVLLMAPRQWIWEQADGVWQRAHGVATPVRAAESLLDTLRGAIGALHPPAQLPDDIPFAGGAVGFLGYDWGQREILGSPLPNDRPSALFGIYQDALIVDHHQRKSWILGAPEQRRVWHTRLANSGLTAGGSPWQEDVPPQGMWAEAQYREAFAAVHRYLCAGDCYQVNLAQCFTGHGQGDPWSLYQTLRQQSPAPFSAFWRHPWGALLSVSPERLLSLRQGSLEARPIKGTAPRAARALEDAANAAALLSSAKDRAENVMIVDLLRNDLGRVAALGSVSVPHLYGLESYAQVHHLVSVVTARLAPQYDAWDAVAAVFPGGSITGAPKRRAMEIIQELEPQARGIYCGSLGYVDCRGEMDWNILIRSLEVDKTGHWRFWGGGGLVVDSQVDMEYAESLQKVEAIYRVLAVGSNQSGRRSKVVPAPGAGYSTSPFSGS